MRFFQKFGKLPGSLRLRLTLVVVLLVLGATVFVTSLALGMVERDMKAVIGNQQYAQLLASARSVDDKLRARQQQLRAMVADLPPAVRDDPSLLRAFLMERSNIRAAFSNIAAFDLRGKQLLTLRQGASMPPQLVRERPHFVETVTGGVGVISAPFRSALTGMPILVMSEPVLNSKGVLAYVIHGVIDLDRASLFDQIVAEHPGKTGFTFIMTTGGILVNHPTRARILEHINARPGVNPATERALGGFEGWMEAPNKDGSPGIYAYRRLAATPWIVGSRFPTDEAFAPISALRQRVLLYAALFAALAGLAGWLAITYLLRPLARLHQQTQLVRAGATRAEVLHREQDDEIGELGEAVYQLVSERQAAQEQIVARESLISNILEHAPDAFVSVDRDGTVLQWNAAAERTFGWTRAEAIGASLEALIVPEAMRADYAAAMAAFAAGGALPNADTRARVITRHRDGRIVPVDRSLGVFDHGQERIATAFLHDASARIAFEEAIAASEKRARTIADAMPALIAYIDKDERYRFTNAGYRDMLGIDPRGMLGKTIRDVLGEAAYAPLKDQIAAALAGHQVKFEPEPVPGKEDLHYIAHFIPDIGADGAVAGFYTLVMNISERKQVELRLADSERQAQAASRAKSEFVANMSHEIRTPLNGVLGIAHLLGATALDAEQRRYVDLVRSSGASLLHVLDEVLDFSKIEAGRMELAAQPFALADMLDAVAAFMTVSAREKALTLSVALDPALPPFLVGDAMRLHQVLTNLVGNAIKFTDHGKVALEVSQLARLGNRISLRLAVTDTGIGISAREQASLFAPFAQADASTTRRFGGTGLGLTICRRIVDLMGGEIAIASVPGQGSAFRVDLTLKAGAAAAPAPPPRRRVLLLAADGRAGAYLTQAMARWEWDLSRVASAAEAAALMDAPRAGGARFDLLLLDWQSCADSGPACADQLRALQPEAPPQVILMMSTHERLAYLRGQGQQRRDTILPEPVTATAVLSALDGAAAPAAGQARLGQLGGALGGVHLLLVEDNELNQLVARGMLEFAGATVETAAGGAEAIALLRRDPGRFALILMDVQMPGMDGFAATAAIRDALGLRTPVLAMSAGVTASERAHCVAAGMDEFIAKPIEPASLVATILRHVPRAARDPDPAPAPPPAPAAPDPGDPVGAGLTRLLSLSAGKPLQSATLLHAIERLVAQAPLDLARARRAWQDGDKAQAATVLHAMRGAVGIMGARGFCAGSLALEAALHGAEGAAIGTLFDALALAMEQELGAAARWLAGHAGLASAADHSAPDPAVLARFERLLGERDIEACDLFQQLRAGLRATLGEAALRKLDAHVGELDFDAALGLLKSRGEPRCGEPDA